MVRSLNFLSTLKKPPPWGGEKREKGGKSKGEKGEKDWTGLCVEQLNSLARLKTENQGFRTFLPQKKVVFGLPRRNCSKTHEGVPESL